LDQFKTSIENISHFDNSTSGEVTPNTQEELEAFVKTANQEKLKLYPVSTGYNWGLGSKVPVVDDSIIVNLKNLNQIHSFDEESGIVILGPGVTQEQLMIFLDQKKSSFYLDVTGSSKDTSIVGNTLERGISYNSLRVDSVHGLEVLTGEGKVIRTGSWRFENSKISCRYKHGVGANLTDLFFQSNFGIVTKMVFQLKRREKYYYSVQLNFKTINELSECLGVYSKLYHDGVINSIFHIANTSRALNAMSPHLRKTFKVSHLELSEEEANTMLTSLLNHGWVVSGVISGSHRSDVKRKVKKLKSELSDYASIRVMSISLLLKIRKILSYFKKFKVHSLIEGIFPFNELSFGRATDVALGSVLDYETYSTQASPAEFVDQSETGFLYCLPLTALDKESCQSLVTVINQTVSDFGFGPSITLNPISPSILEAVVSIDFKREDRESAHRCIRELQKNLLSAGHTPYRTNIKDMDLYFKDDEYFEYLRKIKEIFDPNGVISPGRYLPENL
jgi:4-cresol dehydrogenase (hydroxylating) flavoprotein subunit